MNADFKNKRATVMGLGRFGGGVAAAKWLARQGAIVTVADVASEESLADSLAELDDFAIKAVHLGAHQEKDFRESQLIVVNPAVRPDNEFLKIARRVGATMTSETELFLRASDAKMIGVTGSNGKSTIAAMTEAILRADGRQTWLGGNIGGSLLDSLDQIGPDDWVVLELSSFQLHHLSSDAVVPQVAIVTNCTPNHLDWHANFGDYVAAKQRLITAQKEIDLTVLNTNDSEVCRWTSFVRGRLLPLVSDKILPKLLVHGKHNRINATCAATAALGVGCNVTTIGRGLASFEGLPQRLELVKTIQDRSFYNDSTATTPESTIAALDAIEEPIWLLVGGSDKGIDFGPLVKTIVGSACGAAFYGDTAERLWSLAMEENSRFQCAITNTLSDAIEWCWSRSKSGDSIVLSPACASHDQFKNFKHRGDVFVELVGRLDDRVRR